jgi:hypothetical protein
VAKDKLRAALENKGPGALRQAVTGRQVISPVDIIAAAAAPATPTIEESVRKEIAEEEAGIIEEEKRTEETSKIEDKESRTKKTNAKIDIKNSSSKAIVKSEEKSGVKNTQQENVRKRRTGKPRIHSERDIHALLAIDKRLTERYSFEIYTDQKEDIQRVCDRYEKSTGKKLSASRLIREVLDYFLPGALEAFEDNED